MSGELMGVSVLVTRPAHQAQPFCDMLERAGAQVIRFPVIDIQAIAPDNVTQQVLERPLDGLIFISANAARLGVQALDKAAFKQWRRGRIIAIGQATARALTDMGVSHVLTPPSPYNSEALLAMPEMLHVDGRRFALLKGAGGRPYLSQQLRSRGAIVQEINVYRRTKPQQDSHLLAELRTTGQAVVSITSVKGLHHLFEMATAAQGEWLRQQAYFLTPSQRVADAVKRLPSLKSPIIAENATDAAMLKSLLRFIQ